MKRLFVYGTLCPGRENAHILENIGGEWLAGSVNGTFYQRGWGAAADFPGIVLDEHGPDVPGYLFLSDQLDAHWPMLDAFEDGYDRVEVRVSAEDNRQYSAWIYQLQPQESRLAITAERFLHQPCFPALGCARPALIAGFWRSRTRL